MEEARLVVGQRQLRPAEHVDPALGLQRPDEQAEGVAGGREDEAPGPDARGAGAADPEVAQALERHRPLVGEVGIGQRRGGVEVEAGRAGRGPDGTPIEQGVRLQADFDAEFLGVVQPHFGDQHLDEHLRGRRVQLADQLHDLREELGRSADQDGVRNRFGLQHELSLDGLERPARRLEQGSVLLLRGRRQERVDRGDDVGRGRVAELVNFGLLFRDHGVFEPRDDGADEFQVVLTAGDDERVGPLIGGEPQVDQRGPRRGVAREREQRTGRPLRLGGPAVVEPAPAAGRTRGAPAEEVRDEGLHRRRVGPFQLEDVDERLGGGDAVQLHNQRFEQPHGRGRGRDDDRVDARVRDQVDVFEESRFDVVEAERHGLRAEAGGAAAARQRAEGAGALLLLQVPLGTGTRAEAAPLLAEGSLLALPAGPPRRQEARARRELRVERIHGQGLDQRLGYFVGQTVPQAEDLDLGDGLRRALVEVADEFGDVLLIRRTGLDVHRVAGHVVGHADLVLGELFARIALVEEVLDLAGHGAGGRPGQRVLHRLHLRAVEHVEPLDLSLHVFQSGFGHPDQDRVETR